MKRELAFALDAQSQFNSFNGRTRSSNSPPSLQVTVSRTKSSSIDINSVSKRVKTAIPDGIIHQSDGGLKGRRMVEKVYVKRKKGGNGGGARRFTRSALVEKGVNVEGLGAGSMKSLELRMCKKIGLGRMPINMKELLKTGLLEGFRVYYDFDTAGKNLQGIIKGNGILCSCDLCEGAKVISPSQFELHACKSYRHAIKHTHLENGKSLLDVIDICKEAASKSVDVALQTVISSLPVKGPSVCTKCNGDQLWTGRHLKVTVRQFPLLKEINEGEKESHQSQL